MSNFFLGEYRRFLFTLVAFGFCQLAWLNNSLGADNDKTANLDKSTKATISRLKSDLFYLASPDREGRGPLTNGLQRAGDYIAERFKEIGLKPLAKDGTYFQPFTVGGVVMNEPSTIEFKGPDGKTKAFVVEPGKKIPDATVLALSSEGKATGSLVFAGYGITMAKEGTYDDYQGLNTEKKIVMILRDAPRQGRKDDGFENANRRRALSSLTEKIGNAQKHNAAGVIFVNDKQNAAETDTLIDFAYLATNRFGGKIPVFMISRKLADSMLIASGQAKLADKEAAIDNDLKPQSAEIKGYSVIMDAHLKRGNVIPVRNVVGVLEGSGPLAEEAIVIGAHYDHVGSGGFGSMGAGRVVAIHQGADDNGSGTTAMLELAKRFASHKDRQGRKLIFMAFSAEELGLFGSVHYCKEPLFPLEKTAAMINLDMVGRLRPDKESKKDRILVQGSGTSEGFEALLDKINKSYDFTTVRQKSGFGPSDHSSFASKKIPVLFLWTDVHEDYHRPSDTPDKINYEGMDKIIRFGSEVIGELASVKEKPKFIEVKAARTGGTRQGGPRLGFRPGYNEDEKGVAVEGVTEGEPAAKAGIKAEDKIVKIDGKEVKNLEVYMEIMQTKKVGQTIKIGIIRKGKALELDVKLE
ncbi:MAG: M28 family peptidase [Gemmataceae bacterium]|nr:M28 family peptidase [Gemmataceae bacterium]